MQIKYKFINNIIYLSFVVLLTLAFSGYAVSQTSRMGKAPGSKPRMGNPQSDDSDEDFNTSRQNRNTTQSDSQSKKQKTDTAQSLLEQARTERNPEKAQQQKLQAVRILIGGQFYDQARSILDEISLASLAPSMRTVYKLLQAELALAAQQPEKALALAPKLSSSLPQGLRIQSHKTRAAIFRQMGKRLESLRELTQIESLISDSTELASIHQSIWNTLQQLPLKELRKYSTLAGGQSLSGWLQLGIIYKVSILSPTDFQAKLSVWRSKYPQHQAQKTILSMLAQEQKNIQNRPERLALLLPLKGRIGRSAAAIRDGLLTAHFASSKGRNKITVRIYDTSTHGKNIRGLYSLAVKEGAQFVIGPLRKSNVKQLATIDALPVPVLALNNLEIKPGEKVPSNFFLFGLSPEDEARQIAERAIFENKTRAIAFVPDSRWGGRVLAAFTKRYKELGGDLLEKTKYLPSVSDYSRPLKKLLNLDEAEARHKSLHKLLRVKTLAFEARRRQDADFIFIAAFPRQARLIGPQLRYHNAADIPLYATSHAYQGVVDTARDADMNNLIFCDTPWTLNAADGSNPFQATINKYWPNKIIDFARLYALGVDAYNVTPYLKWLRAKPYERYSGQTGRLSVDNNNRIRRALTWAKIIKGKAVIIQERLVENAKSVR
ncbi:Penicillin-binding protein activator LpoA [hydrothermal vent metagenome]|uniref:Penicillin-binding protein activator LpoA n=1 Tax=hydrothermal vent metagenome TaxID=652676 RepID=A0A3B0YAM7_9ZZZZ